MNRLGRALQKTKEVASVYSLRLLTRIHPIKFSSPPVVLLSYPRSGSSWAGEVLASSPQFAYLREPITQPYLKKFGGTRTVFNLADEHTANTVYKKLANEVFSGCPSVFKGVINCKSDFFPFFKKIQQTLLIKEVNPAAADFYCKNYQPFLIVLLRHPAAVALSFYERGWLKHHGDVLNEVGNSDDWKRFGKLYGTFMAEAVEVASHYQNAKIIRYEALVDDPKQQFSDIFADCGISVPESFGSVIEQYCYSNGDLSSGFQTERDSKLTAQKWKTKLTTEQLNSLREGFLDTPLECYRQPSDWIL